MDTDTARTGQLITLQENQEKSLAVAQQHAVALTSIARSLDMITSFISGGGLSSLLNGVAKTQAANGIIQGLVTHSGREGLDARFMGQNSIEAFHFIEKMYDGFAERLKQKAEGEFQEVDAEKEFSKWLSEQEEKEKQKQDERS